MNYDLPDLRHTIRFVWEGDGYVLGNYYLVIYLKSRYCACIEFDLLNLISNYPTSLLLIFRHLLYYVFTIYKLQGLKSRNVLHKILFHQSLLNLILGSF